MSGGLGSVGGLDRVDGPGHWRRGDPYERYVGRWSRRVAPEFLRWLNEPSGRRWLDVGCGTGALCAAVLESSAPSQVAGVEPSEGFLATAREVLGGRVELHQGTADTLPLPDASVDIVISGLVLNFIPDLPAALAEMKRVTDGHGTIAAYVWDYAGMMQLIRYFWDAAVEFDPDVSALDEGIRFPLCDPDAVRARFAAAGLGDIAVAALDIRTRFADFEDYWQPFLGGQGPAPAYAVSLGEPARRRLRDAIRRRLPIHADGSIALIARAWAIKATAQ